MLETASRGGGIRAPGILWRALRDIVYPPYCLLCDGELSEGSRLVCAKCWTRLESPVSPEIDINGMKVVAAYAYSNDLRSIIHQLKYRGRTHLAARLGEAVGERILDDLHMVGMDMMLPVPLHKVRMRSRGFNQSELLCRHASDISGVPVITEVLVRNRNTKQQSHLNHQERAMNVKGAFTLTEPDRVQGKRVVILDDVITSGSTISECISVAREAGASEVIGMAAAIVV